MFAGDTRRLNDLIAHAKSAQIEAKLAYSSMKARIYIVIILSIISFIIGTGLLAYKSFSMGNFISFDDNLRDFLDAAPTVFFVMSAALLTLALVLYSKLQAIMLGLQLSQERLQRAIAKAEQLASEKP